MVHGNEVSKGGKMKPEIIVGLLSCLGTLIGSIGGIMATSKLTNFRLEQLEKKVDKHNTLIERTFILEGEMKEVQNDIKDLKRK